MTSTSINIGKTGSRNRKEAGKFRQRTILKKLFLSTNTLLFIFSTTIILLYTFLPSILNWLSNQQFVIRNLKINQKQFNKGLNCSKPTRFGDAYGGWSICAPIPTKRKLYPLYSSIVYTVGIGRNIKWDIGMIEKYETEHHGWDPTPTAKKFFQEKSIPKGFYFHSYGLSKKDGNMTLKLPDGNFDSYTILEYEQPAQSNTILSLPMLTLKSMMNKLNHQWLSILKIDIEGAEFDVIEDWYKNNYKIPADQVLIEFHERYFTHDRNYKAKIPRAIHKMSHLDFDLIMYTSLEYTFARRGAIASKPKSAVRLRS